MKILLLILAITVIGAGVFIWRRMRQGENFIAACVALSVALRFISRAAVSPLYNNWILIGLWLITIFLFINALYQGGGEQLGLQALREFGKEVHQEKSSIAKYYSESEAVKYFIAGSDKIPEMPKVILKSWFWWKLWLFSLFVSMVYIPIAFWDEVVVAWNRAREIIEQRTARIKLIDDVKPVATQEGSAKERPRSGFWQGFKERFISSFSADMISESIFEFGGKMLRRLLRGGR